MKILITGATGMVGAELVREAIKDPNISEIIALVRSPLEIKDSKIKEVIHKDFLNYTGLEETFRQVDACIWCLGISQSQVGPEEYEKITFDYTLSAAKAMVAANPKITFMFLSGQGADRTEKSSTEFERIKGKAENHLLETGIKTLYFIRPAGIQPIHKNKKAPLIYKLVIPFYPIVKLFAPNLVITSVELTDAMLYILKNGHDDKIIENKELQRIARLTQNKQAI